MNKELVAKALVDLCEEICDSCPEIINQDLFAKPDVRNLNVPFLLKEAKNRR